MFPNRVVAWCVLATVLIWTGKASAGWIIEQMEKGGGGEQPAASDPAGQPDEDDHV